MLPSQILRTAEPFYRHISGCSADWLNEAIRFLIIHLQQPQCTPSSPHGSTIVLQTSVFIFRHPSFTVVCTWRQWRARRVGLAHSAPPHAARSLVSPPSSCPSSLLSTPRPKSSHGPVEEREAHPEGLHRRHGVAEVQRVALPPHLAELEHTCVLVWCRGVCADSRAGRVSSAVHKWMQRRAMEGAHPPTLFVLLVLYA